MRRTVVGAARAASKPFMAEAPPAAGGSSLPPPSQTSQPPMGVSSATGPTPNKGYEAAAMQRVGLILKMATDALPMAGATTDIGKALLKVINDLSKHVQPGSNTQASERSAIDQMAMKNAQQTQTNQAIRQPQAGGGGGAPPGAGGGMPPGMPPGMGAAA